MRVARVEIRDHAGLGDLDIDFRTADGRAPRLIVIAGENGCGKTAVLEAIFSAIAPAMYLINAGINISGTARIYIEANQLASVPWSQQVLPASLGGVDQSINGIFINVSTNAGGYLDRLVYRTSDFAMSAGYTPEQVLGTNYGCFFSEANVAFHVPPITSVTSLASLSPGRAAAFVEQVPIRGGANTSSQTAQLLVDLQGADAAELHRAWTENRRTGIAIPEGVGERRISLFTSAFDRLVSHNTKPR